MTFNEHSRLIGQHAFLGASKYHWINYDADKLTTAYTNFMAAQKGTELHEFAARCIALGQKLPRSKKTLNSYVNDAIGFRMTPEQVLCYSENCFGTADSICFRDDILRINSGQTFVGSVLSDAGKKALTTMATGAMLYMGRQTVKTLFDNPDLANAVGKGSLDKEEKKKDD